MNLEINQEKLRMFFASVGLMGKVEIADAGRSKDNQPLKRTRTPTRFQLINCHHFDTDQSKMVVKRREATRKTTRNDHRQRKQRQP